MPLFSLPDDTSGKEPSFTSFGCISSFDNEILNKSPIRYFFHSFSILFSAVVISIFFLCPFCLTVLFWAFS